MSTFESITAIQVPVLVTFSICTMITALTALALTRFLKGEEDREFREGCYVAAAVCAGMTALFLQVEYLPQLPGWTIPVGMGVLGFLWVLVLVPKYFIDLHRLKIKHQAELAELEVDRPT